MPANFRPIFHINRLQNEEQICSVIWVNKRLNTNKWIELVTFSFLLLPYSTSLSLVIPFTQ